MEFLKSKIYLFFVVIIAVRCSSQSSSEMIVESDFFDGSIEDARNIASGYRLAGNINLSSLNIDIDDSGVSSAYDSSRTYIHLQDKSQDYLKTIRELLCLYIVTDLPALVSIDYNKTNTTHKDISNCYKKIEEDDNEAVQLKNINYRVNLKSINEKTNLVSHISYIDATDKSKPDLGVTATFDVSNPPSDLCPLGDFKIEAKIVGPNVAEWTNWSQEKAAGYVANIPELATSSKNCDQSVAKCITMEVKCNKNSKNSSDRIEVIYKENSSVWSGKKNLKGFFSVDQNSGMISSGSYSAVVQGYNQENGSSGGDYRVSFDKDFFLRVRSIPDDDPDSYIKDYSNSNILISSYEDTKCLSQTDYEYYVWGYKVFDTLGNNIDLPTNQNWIIESGSRNKSGYANYYNVRFYKENSKEVEAPQEDESICHLDYPLTSDGSVDTTEEYARICDYNFKKDSTLWTKEKFLPITSLAEVSNKKFIGYSDSSYDYIISYLNGAWFIVEKKSTSQDNFQDVEDEEIDIGSLSFPKKLFNFDNYGDYYIVNKVDGEITFHKVDNVSPFFPQQQKDLICLSECPISPTYDNLINYMNSLSGGNYTQITEAKNKIFDTKKLTKYILTNNSFSRDSVSIDFDDYNRVRKEGFSYLFVSTFILENDYDSLKQKCGVDIECYQDLAVEKYSLVSSSENITNGYLVDKNSERIDFYNPLVLISTSNENILGSLNSLDYSGNIVFWKERFYLHAPSFYSSIKDPITNLYYERRLPILSLKNKTIIEDPDKNKFMIKSYFTEVELKEVDLSHCNDLEANLPTVSSLNDLK